MGRRRKVSVLNYTDYRKYLEDFYNEQKARTPGFSYRNFARKAGFNSSGLFKDVISGRINIEKSVIRKFARGTGLTPREAEYFRALVLFNQSRSNEQKNRHFKKLVGFWSGPSARLRFRHHRYFSRWYYAAIREMLSVIRVKENFRELARSLRPQIRSVEVKRAVNLLLKLGIIRRDAAGYLEASDQVLSTGPDFKSLHLANFQRTMMDLAKESIDRIPAKQRNVATLTFSATQKAIEDIQTEINASRKRIIGIIRECKDMDRIYQMNVQLFPMSHIKDVK